MFNKNAELVKEYIKKLALKKHLQFFYATEVANHLSLPLEECFKELDKLVSEEILHIRYEIRTIPELDVIDIVDDYSNIVNKTMLYEDEEYEISYENIFPIYYIDENFKKFVLENSQQYVFSP